MSENNSIVFCPGSKVLELIDYMCVQGSANGTNGIPISFNVLPMVQYINIPRMSINSLKQYYNSHIIPSFTMGVFGVVAQPQIQIGC